MNAKEPLPKLMLIGLTAAKGQSFSDALETKIILNRKQGRYGSTKTIP